MLKINIQKSKIHKKDFFKNFEKYISDKNIININCSKCGLNLGIYNMKYLEKGKVFCSECDDFLEIILNLENLVNDKILFSSKYFEDIGDAFVESIYDEKDLMKILEKSLKIKIK